MRNEYGAKLDKNLYAPSIMTWPDDVCAICGKMGELVRHEVFHGALYRERSKMYGCWVNLCPECHMHLHNKDSSLDKGLKRIVQAKAMQKYGWNIADFRLRFGKNYLGVDDE